MAVRNRAQLNSEADANLPDNVSQEITPEDVRSLVKNLADSALLAQDVGNAAYKNVGTGANDVAVGNHTHADATTTVAGFMSAANVVKLNGIEALADVTDAANVGSAINGVTAKATPVDADTIPLIDSAASNTLKKFSWANLKAVLKTYFDTLYAGISHTQAWSTITSTPTTLSGYGISDAAPLSHVGTGGAQHAEASTSVAGFMSSSDKTKLNGIADGAQVNSVNSVSGRTGAVVLTKGDVGLGNVDNTSDAAKPISTATQTALNGKAATDLSNVTEANARSKVGTGTMAYRNVTISTSDPSGGVNGDVWFKV
jgi:hypothetical protein